MPRPCSVCGHKELAEIDAALLEKVPLRQIAKRHDVGTSALFRHNREHLISEDRNLSQIASIANGTSELSVFEPVESAIRGEVDSEALVNHLGQLHANTLRILGEAQARGRHDFALRARAGAPGSRARAAPRTASQSVDLIMGNLPKLAKGCGCNDPTASSAPIRSGSKNPAWWARLFAWVFQSSP